MPVAGRLEIRHPFDVALGRALAALRLEEQPGLHAAAEPCEPPQVVEPRDLRKMAFEQGHAEISGQGVAKDAEE